VTLKLKNNIFKLCLSILILFSLTCLLCACGSKKYKYNNEIYEDSYNYKNDYGYIYLEKNNTRLASLYEEVYLKMVDFNHKKDDVSKKEYKELFIKAGSFKEGPYSYDDILTIYMYITSWNPSFYFMMPYIDGDNYSLGISRLCLKGNDRENFEKTINNELNIIDTLIETIDDEFDRIIFLSDYIMDNMTYKEESGVGLDSGWAHSIVGFFDRKMGVCESYAKVFKLLCDRYNIGNIPVTSDEHIWNLVLYDNKWYVFDLTYSDGSNYSYFGKTEEVYNDSDHEYQNILYELPDNKATTPLSLGKIELKENGNVIKTSHSIDTISSYLNNGNYEIVLNTVSGKKNTNFYISTLSSNYESLTIKSNQKDNEKMNLYLIKDITLTKDTTLSNIYFDADTNKVINLDGVTLYLKDVTFSSTVKVEGGNVIYID